MTQRGFSFPAARAALLPQPNQDLLERVLAAGRYINRKPLFKEEKDAKSADHLDDDGSHHPPPTMEEEEELRSPFSWEWEQHVIEKERKRREAEEDAYCTSSEDDFGDPQLAIVRKLRHDSDSVVNKCPICPSHGIVVNLHKFRDARRKNDASGKSSSKMIDDEEAGGTSKKKVPQEEVDEEENDDELYKFRIGSCGMCMDSDVTTTDPEAFFCYTCGTTSLVCVVCAKLDMSCHLPSIWTDQELADKEKTDDDDGPCQGKLQFNAKQLSANPFPQSRKRGKQRCNNTPECKWPWLYECSSCERKMCIECFKTRRWRIVDAEKKRKQIEESDQEDKKDGSEKNEPPPTEDPEISRSSPHDPSTARKREDGASPRTKNQSQKEKSPVVVRSASKISVVSSSPSVQILSTPPLASSLALKSRREVETTKNRTSATKGKKVQIQDREEGGSCILTGKRDRNGLNKKSTPLSNGKRDRRRETLSNEEVLDLLLEEEAELAEVQNQTQEEQLARMTQAALEFFSSEEREDSVEVKDDAKDDLLLDHAEEDEAPASKRQRTDDERVTIEPQRSSNGAGDKHQPVSMEKKKKKKPLITPGRSAVVAEVLSTTISELTSSKGNTADSELAVARFQDQFKVYDATKLFCRLCGGLFYPASVSHGVSLLREHRCPAMTSESATTLENQTDEPSRENPPQRSGSKEEADWQPMEPQAALELFIHALKHPANSASYM